MTTNFRVIRYSLPIFPPEPHYTKVLTFDVLGNLPRKSNQRRIVKVKRKNGAEQPLIIKSKNALSYTKAFLENVPDSAKVGIGGILQPLALWAHVHYQSNRSDLSAELLKDLLEQAGVITNDRWIKAEFLFASVDRDNPRVELALYEISMPSI